jgi:alpha-mannosidase
LKTIQLRGGRAAGTLRLDRPINEREIIMLQARRCPLLLTVFVFILPALAAAAAPDVYVVPFSHLDLYWAGTREECLSRGNRIIAKAVQMATRYPQFRFLLEDEVFVANFVETHPGSPELEQLKRLVTEGRIELSPKWAAILQNMPRGEAHVRNVVYGKRYAREVFGADPLVANLGDLPGYTSQFPQILARSRVPYMVMTRMGPADKSLFYYKALDGSRALVWNTLKGYGWGTFITSQKLTDEQKRARLEKDLADVGKTTNGPILMNWGTDLWAPADNLVEAIEAFSRSSGARLVFATPTEFFRRAEKTPAIPETGGEIPHAWANILSSVVHLWPPTTSATDVLVTAEKFAAINHALGYAAYPQQEFDGLWKKVLEAMDHNNYGQGGDIGDARKLEYANIASVRGEQILRDSLRNIAERVRSPFPRSMPIVVFNPLSWTRDDVVRTHLSLYGDASPGDIDDYRKAIRLVDETGASIPFYVEQFSGTVSRALEMVFLARGVPSLGYKTYFIVPADKPDVFPNTSEIKPDADEQRPKRVIGADQLENEYYRVSVDRATGAVTVFDKELNRAVAKDMEIVAAEERGGNSLSQEVMSGRTIINTVSRVEIEENNPVRTIARIEGALGGVPVTQRLFLYRGAKRVDVENIVDWKPGRLLKIEQTFPYEHPDAQIQYGVPFGAVSGSDFLPQSEPRAGDEISKEFWKQWRQIQDWVFAGTSEWGVTIAADRQVITLAPGAVRAGMLRGTYSAVGITRRDKPFLLTLPPAGKYVFHYSVSSGKGDWVAAKSYRAGMALNNPLIPVAVADDLSRKSLPPAQSFCSFESGNLVVSALKKADADGGVILRAFEMEGSAADTSVEFLNQKRPFQEVNLLEEDLRLGDQKALRVRPHEIRTLKFQVK